RDDLAAMAHDAGIGEAAGDVLLAERRHLVEIEAGKGSAEAFPLAQDGQPGQARLEPFQADLLEQPVVAGDGIAPFLVMVATVIVEISMPRAAQPPVHAFHQSFCRHCPLRFPFVPLYHSSTTFGKRAITLLEALSAS